MSWLCNTAIHHGGRLRASGLISVCPFGIFAPFLEAGCDNGLFCTCPNGLGDEEAASACSPTPQSTSTRLCTQTCAACGPGRGRGQRPRPRRRPSDAEGGKCFNAQTQTVSRSPAVVDELVEFMVEWNANSRKNMTKIRRFIVRYKADCTLMHVAAPAHG